MNNRMTINSTSLLDLEVFSCEVYLSSWCINSIEVVRLTSMLELNVAEVTLTIIVRDHNVVSRSCTTINRSKKSFSYLGIRTLAAKMIRVISLLIEDCTIDSNGKEFMLIFSLSDEYRSLGWLSKWLIVHVNDHIDCHAWCCQRTKIILHILMMHLDSVSIMSLAITLMCQTRTNIQENKSLL